MSILIVDDEHTNRRILEAALQKHGHETHVVSDGGEALRTLDEVELVLLDLHMPGIDGLETLTRIKQIDEDMPVVMVSSVDVLDKVRSCLTAGAFDYLLKPVDMSELYHTVGKAILHGRLLRERRAYHAGLEEAVAERTAELEQALSEIQRSYQATVLALGSALETRDVETQAHSLRVAAYSLLIAREMGVTDPQTLSNIERGAYLHDIGKIGVPDAILSKPAALDDDEWVLMRRHTSIGVRLLRNIDFLHGAIPTVQDHHERWDGNGYPSGKAGTEIALEARIFSVADTVDAVTSDRPYRAGRSFAAAREIVLEEAGAQFDPEVTAAFARLGIETLTAARGKTEKFLTELTA